MDLKLNDVFEKNCRVFNARPVTAARYKKGMENGYQVCFTYGINEGFKFFATEQEAMEFYERKPLQQCLVDGSLQAVECKYNEPEPILYEPKTAVQMEEEGGCPLQSGLIEDESCYYNFFTLYEGSWIIKDSNGSVRVWDKDDLDSPFIGGEYNCMYTESITDSRCNEEWLQKIVS